MKHFCVLLIMFSSLSFAIDNPDAPDYMRGFKLGVKKHENKINQLTSTLAYVKTYRDYERFLDKQLNRFYTMLARKLSSKERLLLRRSQREWLKYRNAEFRFISENWTRKNFGSSAVISRGSYRTSIIKARVIGLIYYLRNYP